MEVQLRSVFEDAWGEINHLLDYGPKKDALAIAASTIDVEPGNTFPEVWSQHLNALKALADGCAQYADVIRRQYVVARDGGAGIGVGQRNPQPADSTDETAAQFSACNKLVRDAVNTALSARDEAQKVLVTEGTRRARAFRDAANAFEFARSVLDPNPPVKEPSYEVLDRGLRAHSAYCLMFTGNDELVNKAEKILRQLLDEDKDDPVPSYRLGQILEGAGKFAEARELFEDGVRRLRETNLAADHWLRSSMPRALGYIIWSLARTETDDEKRRSMLEDALRFTGDALHAARTQQHQDMARNNIICYALDLAPLVDDQSQLLSAVKEHFEVLNERADLKHDDMRRLDTLMRAAYRIGEFERAKSVAERLMEYFHMKIFGGGEEAGWREKIPSERELLRLSAVERDVYHFAQRVLLRDSGNFSTDVVRASEGGVSALGA